MTPELQNFVHFIMNNRVTINTRINPLVKEVEKSTSFLTTTSLVHRAWHLYNGITTIPVCPACNIKPLAWHADIKNYRQFCSTKCSTGNQTTINKARNTCLQNYGETHFSKTKEYTDKVKKTSLERFGVEHHSKTSDFAKRIEITNLERYGCKAPAQNTEVRQKMSDTLFKNYGVTNAMQIPESKDKIKNTNMLRYGVEYPYQSPEIFNKLKDTNMRKYGVECALQHPDIIAKGIETNFKKYLRSSSTQAHISLESLEKTKDKAWLEEQNKTKTVGEIAAELGISSSHLCKIFKKHNLEPTRFFRSTFEKEISQEVQNIYNGTILYNTRIVIAPYELDIYLPDENLAIELNGVFFHSELHGKDSIYHNKKLELCNKAGIRLIQITDNEFILHKNIVLSRIKNLLGKSDKIYARKCNIEEVSSHDCESFLEENHIQGHVNSYKRIGLYFNDELVSLMTFSKPRFNKKHTFELIRFCNKLDTTVVGGASRLLKYFVKNYCSAGNSIISYSDRRWSKGNLYINLGFTYEHTSAPNFMYFHRGNILKLKSRLPFQKHRLHKTLDTFDPKLTAWENMQLNGYNRIWDCGNDVWTLTI